MNLFLLLICAAIAYVVGSINPGIVISNQLGKDIRNVGSGNPGASNMLRVFGPRYGILTYVLDVVKAAITIGIGILIAGEYGGMVSGLFTIIGHDWPCWYRFRGGKGVACSSAVYILLFPIYGIPAAVLCILTVWITRFISLGSMVMAIVFLILSAIFMPFWPYTVWALILAALCVYRHRGNIVRLLNGTERKIGAPADK